MTFQKGVLFDLIKVSEISVEDFNQDWDFNNPKCVGMCHNEATNKNIIKFDKTNSYIVSATRPTNMFWSYQSSNMLQQSYTLEEFFKLEEERVKRRKNLINFY